MSNANANSNAVSIGASDLDPLVVSLGEMVGLLAANGDEVTLQQDWFSDPLTKTRAAALQNPDALVSVITQLLGEVGGNALGIPAQDPNLLGTWYPIQWKGQPTGVYIVSYTPAGKTNTCVLGLGVRAAFHVSTSDNAPAGSAGAIDAQLWGMVPLLELGNGTVSVALASAGRPLSVGASLAGADDKTLFDGLGISLAGVSASAMLDVAASDPLSFTLAFSQLKLPTADSARDVSLADLEALTADQVLSIVAALAMSALSEATGGDQRLGFVLPALGLASAVPGVDAQLPLLGWTEIAEHVASGNAAQPFLSWFTALVNDPKLAGAWLQAVAGVLGSAAPTVSGSGTRNDPLAIDVFSAQGVGALSLTLASETDQTGTRKLYPGILLSTNPAAVSSQVVLVVDAALELLEIDLSATGQVHASGPSSLQGRASLAVRNPTAGTPLFAGTISGDTYRFGSLTAGLALAPGLQVVPSFQLLDVVTPNGKYAALDLMQPAQVAQVALSELIDAVTKQLQTLLGLTANANDPFGQPVAALVGLVPPRLPDGATWPSTLAPPLSAAALINTLQHPIAALSRYYAALLTTPVSGSPAFTYLLAELGALLAQAGAPAISVQGQGQVDDPWRVSLLGSGTAELIAYRDAGAGAPSQLTFGLGAKSTVELGNSNQLSLEFLLSIVQLAFAADGTPLLGAWLPRLGFVATLPQTLSSPKLLGALVSVAQAAASASWSADAGWVWNMIAQAPSLTVGSSVLPIGGDLAFSNATGLDALVTQQAAVFAPLLVRLLGLFVARTQRPAAYALDGVLGLAPGLDSVVPAALNWPADMPLLTPTGFSDPVGDLARQLAALTANQAYLAAACRIMAWAFSSDGSVPTVPGAGTIESPYELPVGLPVGLRVWASDTGALGIGIGRSEQTAVGSLVVTTDLTVRALELALSGNAADAESLPVPSLALQVEVAAANGALATSTSGVPIMALIGGAVVALDAQGAPSATPLTLIQLGGDQPQLVNAATLSAEQWIDEALNAGFQALASALASNSKFQTVYGLLADFGLVLVRSDANAPYGIIPSGWNGLLSDPTTWLTQHACSTLAEPSSRADLRALLARLAGRQQPIELPTLLAVVFEALGIVSGPDTGFTLRPDAVVALAAHPLQTLIARTEALLNEPTQLATLVSELAGSTLPAQLGPFTWSVSDGAVVSIVINDAAPITIGGVLQCSGQLSLDLRNETLALTGRAYVPTIGVGLSPSLSWSLATPNTQPFTLQMTWGSAQTPSALPLTLYPFNATTFLAELTELAPRQALSSFVTLIFDPHVLQPYAVARALLMPLGLVVTAQDGSAHLKSLLGWFTDPLNWLLSDAVIGRDGRLHMQAIAALLAGIPSAAVTDGIFIKQNGAQGVELGGLPYGVSFNLVVASDQTLTFSAAVSDLPIGSGQSVATLSLDVGLTLDETYQPGVTGSLKVTESSTHASVSAGFAQQAFSLRIASANGGPSLTLLPFAGWQTLAQVAAQAMAQVVQQLTSKLLDQLQQDPHTATFIATLRTAAGPTELNVADLITKLSSATSPADVVTQALAWLTGRLSAANAPNTVQALITVLSPHLTGLSASGGLLRYAPSDELPLALLLGRDAQSLLGLWAELNLPQDGVVQVQIPRTGVGFADSASFPITFSFGLSIRLPIVDDTTGPALTLSYDAASGRVQVQLDPQQSGSTNSSLAVEILPSFFANQPDGVEAWLLQVLTHVLPRYASIALLNLPPVRQWLDAPLVSAKSADGNAAPSPGALFVGGQILLKEANGNYVLNSLDSLIALPPLAFIAGFLKALLAEQIKVFAIGDSGGIFLGSDATLGYGVRVYAPDLALAALPRVTFQLGATDSDWIAAAGGPSDLEPGISVYLPIPAQTPEFENTTLSLVNVGLDMHGADQAPLVQLSRFELGAVKPRFLGSLQFSALAKPVIGGAVSIQNVGFAVAPNSLSSGSKLNPVAANMLGSGSASKPDADNPPTDPNFSARVAYVKALSAGFIDADGKLTDSVMMQVQQSFGPLNVQQVGLGWDNDDHELSLMFSGGLDIGPLAMQVVDLSVTLPVTDPTNYEGYGLDLQGLAVSFTTASVVLAGALLKYEAPERYDGVVALKVGTFSLTAAGSYTTIPESPSHNSPSFFVFAASGTPLGGPPAFFIRGFSAGFGYNRSLRLPTAAEIPDYLLVQGSLDPTSVFGSDPTPANALQKLAGDVQPKVGSYWLAAGVHFTSFALLDSVALLVATFGNDFSLGLLGVSRLTLPPLVSQKSSALLYVELGLSVTIQPSVGLLAATAQLTPNSFVLDQSCKLTGGFAFYLWFSPNAHAGDFVLTVGGYNANYTPPDYYPTVPRLGLSWPIDTSVGSVSIVGNAYFALTPNAIMCGGLLDLQFSAGPIRAWFTASADFLIAWKPFYYDIRIEISIGVSFTASLFGVSVTLKAELGAGLELWGPPTAGTAHVSWYVISFTIPIGDQNKKLETQTVGDWATFAANFLPPSGESQPSNTTVLAAAAPSPVSPNKNVLTMSMSSGQLTQPQQSQAGVAPSDPSVWTIKRVGFAFVAQTPVPLAKVSADELAALTSQTGLGVRPMAISKLHSELTFEIVQQGSTTPFPLKSDTFTLSAITSNAPMALWDGAPFDNGAAPDTATTLPNVLLGATLAGVGYDDVNPLGPIALSVFDTEEINPLVLPLTLTVPYAAAPPYSASTQASALARLKSSIMSAEVIAARNQILAKLRDYHLVAPTDPNVSVLSTQADNVYQQPPVLARLGETIAATSSVVTSTLRAVQPALAAPAVIAAPKFVALTRRYTVPSGAGQGRTFARAAHPAQLHALSTDATLHDGNVALWSVDPKVATPISYSGALPVHALCFDRRGELCGAQAMTSATRVTQTHAMAQDTATLALVASADHEPGTAGWTRATPLVRVSSRVLLGEHCLVRPQGIVRGRDIGPHAVLSVKQVLQASMVKGVSGVRTGWITTMLPAHLDRADVLVAGGADDVEVCVLVTQDGKQTRRALTPIGERKVADGVALTFDTSGAAIGPYVHLMVRTRQADELRGVIGFVSEPTAPSPLAARASHALRTSAAGVAAQGAQPDARKLTAHVSIGTSAWKESA